MAVGVWAKVGSRLEECFDGGACLFGGGHGRTCQSCHGGFGAVGDQSDGIEQEFAGRCQAFDLIAMQMITYSTHSRYLPELERWLSANERSIETGAELSTSLQPRTGFARQEAMLRIISSEHRHFQSDWPYGKTTFPSRLKALATALRNLGLFGAYHSSHCAGDIRLRRTEPDASSFPLGRQEAMIATRLYVLRHAQPESGDIPTPT